jgi:hypothetical protein
MSEVVADGTDYRPFDPPKRAILYLEDDAAEVLVLRMFRGRCKITVPEGSEPLDVAVGNQRSRYLKPGQTTSVASSLIEFVDPVDPLPGGEADP